MKRFFGIFLLTLATFSVLLCLITTLLWIRSYFVNDWFDYQLTQPQHRRWTGYTLSSNSGSLYFSISRFRFNQDGQAESYARAHPDPEGFSWRRHPPSRSRLLRGSLWRKLGFLIRLEFDTAHRSGSYSFPRAFIPHWFITLLTAPLPIWLLIRTLRLRRRRRRGLCLQCGYDLRSSPTLCPECGATPQPAR